MKPLTALVAMVVLGSMLTVRNLGVSAAADVPLAPPESVGSVPVD